MGFGDSNTGSASAVSAAPSNDLLDLDMMLGGSSTPAAQNSASANAGGNDLLGDMMDLFGGPPS